MGLLRKPGEYARDTWVEGTEAILREDYSSSYVAVTAEVRSPEDGAWIQVKGFDVPALHSQDTVSRAGVLRVYRGEHPPSHLIPTEARLSDNGNVPTMFAPGAWRVAVTG